MRSGNHPLTTAKEKPFPRLASAGARSRSHKTQEAKRQKPEQRRSVAKALPVTAVERRGIAAGVVGGWVSLLTAGAAAAPAAPAHGGPLAREAVAVAQQPAAKHASAGRPERT